MLTQELFRKIRHVQIRTEHLVSDLFSGAYHSAFKGKGMEFEEVRPYQPGDDIRTIDWNVTARMAHPFVKNFREERELTVMLLVDVSGSTLFGTQGASKKEQLAEMGAMLAFSAIKNNDKVGLILFSDEIELYLPPQKGHRHVLRVIRELLAHQATHRRTDLGKALRFLGKVQKRRGVAFLLSDFLCEVPKKEFAFAAKRHDFIGLCLRDLREREIPAIGLVSFYDMESGEQRLLDTSRPEIRKALSRHAQEQIQDHERTLLKSGASFLKLEDPQAYASALHHFFHMRAQKR